MIYLISNGICLTLKKNAEHQQIGDELRFITGKLTQLELSYWKLSIRVQTALG